MTANSLQPEADKKDRPERKHLQLLKKIKNICAASLFVTGIILSCGREPDVSAFYRESSAYYAESSRGDMSPAGRSGDTLIRRSDFLYAVSDYESVDARQLKEMPAEIRAVFIKKLLLRRAAIQEGMREDMYSSLEALQFILPRLEKIMEEYYYFKKAQNLPTVSRLSADDIQKEAAMRMYAERRKELMQRLIKRQNPFEVFP